MEREIKKFYICAATEYLWIFWFFFSCHSSISLFTAVSGNRKETRNYLDMNLFVHLDMHLWPRACLARDVLSFYVVFVSLLIYYAPPF